MILALNFIARLQMFIFNLRHRQSGLDFIKAEMQTV